MGLDSIEIVMECENAFQLSIPDADAERLTTVGALVEYIAERKGIALRRACPTAHVFYALRREMRRALLSNARMRPDEPLLSLASRPQYPALARALACRGLRDFTIREERFIPEEVCDGAACLALAVAPFVAILGAIGQDPYVFAAAFVLGVLGIKKLERRFPVRARAYVVDRHVTVADVVRLIAPAQEYTAESSADRREYQEINDRVRAIIAGVIGIDIDRIRESHSFANDLGCD